MMRNREPLRLLSPSRSIGASLRHARYHQPRMNCARLRLSAETTTIFVRDGWLVIEVAETDSLREQLAGADGDRMVTVAEVSEQTGFTAGAVRDWIKRSILPAVKVGEEYPRARSRPGKAARRQDSRNALHFEANRAAKKSRSGVRAAREKVGHTAAATQRRKGLLARSFFGSGQVIPNQRRPSSNVFASK